MFTFAEKQRPAHHEESVNSTISSRVYSGPSRQINSSLNLQRTIENHAVQRSLQANAEEREDSSLTSASPPSSHDFSRIPAHDSSRSNIQPMPLHTGGRLSLAPLALYPKFQGYGEKPEELTPKPEKPTTESETESLPPTPQAGCGCSNLRLAENRYDGGQKKVKYLFDVAPGVDPQQCVLVQQVIGEKYHISLREPVEKMHSLSIAILGEEKNFNFPNWEIDSPDKDPVVWSNPRSRWNYSREGEHTFSAYDAPSFQTPYEYAPSVSAAKFKTGLYCASQVPTTLTAASQLGAPLEEVEWEDSTCWEFGKEPIHPGFGKECVWSPTKPRE